MQKNEFEKQMQQKMDDLRIHPSESVWENVRAQITKQKQRRRGVIILLFAFLSIFSGAYWLLHPGNQFKKSSDKPLIITENNKLDRDRKIPAQVPETNSNKNAGKNFIGKSVNTPHIHNSSSEKNFTDFNKKKRNNFYNNTKTQIEENYYANEAKPALREINEENKLFDSIPERPALLSQSLPQDIKPKNDTLKPSPVLKKEIANKKEHKWKLGFLFSGGISAVATNFLGFSEDKSLLDYQNLNNGPGTGSNVIIYPSKIKQSAAFIVGLYVEKNISKKKMITAGLNYKMFSTTNKVGVRNDSSQRYSLNNAVNNYHNYYHFIELPVSLKVQISSKKIPLFWDAGISLSQLINSNALQVNNSPIAYYHNNSMFNKSQLGFNTGFSASLFSNKNTPVLFGPYIYYGTTKVANEGLYKNQHFTFIGLRSQILFKK